MTAAAAVPETLSQKRSALTPNLHLFNASQRDLARMLLDEGQNHLFEHWSEPGTNDLEKENFMRQVEKLHANYPGGLRAYIRNARKLLADSRAGKNPFDGFIPSIPTGEKLSYGDEKFTSLEDIGVAEASKAAFVLVAGGLGERLGYSGIKIALPSETTTGTSFLQLYIESILALQSSAAGKVDIPFVIMTSDDTHSLTENLLRANNYYGMKPGQITLLKQEKVACLADSNAKIALDPNNSYLIQTKPHGHGDVHAVLFSSGLLQKWQQEGRKWVLFFQDTNGLLFKVIPAALGVSAAKDWDMNSLAVPRKAKEPIGGIACLTHQNGKKMVINVEYNQLDPLLRATGNVHGDVNDETGYSPYPGNINQLILKLSTYINVLSETHGAIVEFVNPKYKDASRSSFKSSTRLECMMQDFPRSLPASANVGFTVMDAWLAYAPVKNNPEDAAKVPEGNPHHSATTGEMAIYRCNSLILRKAGVHVEEPRLQVFNGQKVELWPRIIWKPQWGLKFSDIKRKISGHCKISQRSTLVLWGREISIHDLTLDGTLVVNAIPQAKVELQSLQVENEGWAVEPVDYKDESIPEEIRIRGFKIVKQEEKTLEYNTPGNCFVGAEHN